MYKTKVDNYGIKQQYECFKLNIKWTAEILVTEKREEKMWNEADLLFNSLKQIRAQNQEVDCRIDEKMSNLLNLVLMIKVLHINDRENKENNVQQNVTSRFSTKNDSGKKEK